MHYYEGLIRVGKVVLTFPNYEKIVINKPLFVKIQSQLSSANFTKDTPGIIAVSILIKSLEKFKPKIYPIGDFEVLSYGNTMNNRREFKFIDDIITNLEMPPLTQHNLANFTPIISKEPLDLESNLVRRIKDLFSTYFQERELLKPELLFQAITYTLQYLNFFLSFKSLPESKKILLGVMANDHAPTQVAFSMTLKELNIPRLYLQHAEVSECFPPLDFEISILHNEHSLDIYRKNGSIQGKTFILPRFTSHFNLEGLRKERKNLVTVGIYLSSTNNRQVFNSIIELLSRNPNVKNIFIKPHPQLDDVKIKDLCGDEAIKIEKNIPEYDHIAIVPNSSVVVELLHKGIPVFHFFELGTINCFDYYGFVRTGIVKHLDFKEINTDFWENYNLFFNKAWLKNYAKINPAVKSTTETAQTIKELVNTISKILYTNNKAEIIKNEKLINKLLCITPLTLLSIVNRINEKVNSKILIYDESIVPQLTILFNNRASEIHKILKIGTNFETNSASICWIKLKNSEWPGNTLIDKEIEDIFQFITKYNASETIKKTLESMFADALLKLNNLNLFCALLDQAKYIKPEKLNLKQKEKLIKLVKSNKFQKEEAIICLLENINSNLNDYDKFKLEILSSDPKLGDPCNWNHKLIEDKFKSLISSKLLMEYETIIAPFYNSTRSQMLFMDVCYNIKEREDFYDKIKIALISKNPLSFIRLGDGEAYIFSNNYRYFSKDDAHNRERHWWGEELQDQLNKEITSALLNSVINADILGIPAIYRFIRDCSIKTTSFLNGNTLRGSLEVLNSLPSILKPATILTDAQSNQFLFNPFHKLTTLSKSASRTVLISSLSNEIISSLFSSLNSFAFIQIPTHIRQQTNSNYHTGNTTLPYTYKTILEKIREVVRPGDLVLVAGGVIGKAFINEAKQMGAVSLDIGSSIDNLVHNFKN
ncbi:MAG TPA: hypothetical protein DD381_10240 [Lentisphaeria bacterium]|nr:MAG: hypothetical protein A2X47_12015 [Lentisphaerae bacterium GWF2_38_69]HBM16704.1 hypothetical protein [Lentisphaeria bacterium]